MSNSTIGERVRFLRTKAGLTMEDLANTLLVPVLENNKETECFKSVTKATIGNLENNRNKPNIDLIISLSDYFKVSTDWILKGKEYEGKKLDELPHEQLKHHYESTPEDKIKELEESIQKLRSDLGL